jgi:hypothetical protein
VNSEIFLTPQHRLSRQNTTPWPTRKERGEFEGLSSRFNSDGSSVRNRRSCTFRSSEKKDDCKTSQFRPPSVATCTIQNVLRVSNKRPFSSEPWSPTTVHEFPSLLRENDEVLRSSCTTFCKAILRESPRSAQTIADPNSHA